MNQLQRMIKIGSNIRQPEILNLVKQRAKIARKWNLFKVGLLWSGHLHKVDITFYLKRVDFLEVW